MRGETPAKWFTICFIGGLALIGILTVIYGVVR